MRNILLVVISLVWFSGCAEISDINPSYVSSLMSDSGTKKEETTQNPNEVKHTPQTLNAKEPRSKAGAEDNYNICNGQEISKSKILFKYVHKEPGSNYKGFELYDVVACDGGSFEEAVFVRQSSAEVIRAILDLNDENGGIIKNLDLKRYYGKSKESVGIENWVEGSYIVDYYEGVIIETQEAYLDFIINENTVLSISLFLQEGGATLGTIAMYGNIDVEGVIRNFKPSKKPTSHSASRVESSPAKETSVTDSAVNALKSFF